MAHERRTRLANGFERADGGQRFRRYWLPVLAYVALIFTLSAQPGLHVPGEFEYRDKLAHLLEYGGLGWLTYRAARNTWPQAAFVRRALLAAVTVSALGASDELFQSRIPGRDSSVYDWAADSLGASLAQLLGLTLDKRRGVV
jgi:VanZ family protein